GRAPLQIDDGTNTMIIGNVVKNFTSPIDASVTKGGSIIANNVIKNCDSGLFLYGSTFVVSSPNVIMGPANESISTVDVLNSEFDSVNILRSKMQQSLAHNDGYISDPLVYQENGETVDLTLDSVNSGTGNVIYRANLVMGYKSSADAPDGVEETFYGHEVGPGATDIGGTNWSLTTSSQNSLVTGKEYRITDLGNTNPVDWTRVGANVNKEGTTFIYNGSELKRKDGSSNPQSGKVSSFEFAGFMGENLVDIANVTGISSGAVSAVSHGLIAGNKVRITDTSETLADGDYIVAAANLGADAFTLTGLSGTATTSEALATVIVQKVEEDVWYDSISKDTAFKKYDNAEVDATDGQFQFHIIDPTLSRLVTGVYSRGALASLYTKKKKTSAVDTNSARIHPHNTHHIGVSWSANYRGKVKAGQIQNTGTWDATTNRLYNASTGLDHNGKNASLGTGNVASGDVTAIMNTNRRYRDFTCLITESNYIQVGSMVTIDGHSGFQIGRTLGATASSEPYGIVVAYEDTATANQKSLTVRYFGEESSITYQNLIDSGVLEAGDANSGNNIHPDYVNAGFNVNSSFAPYDVVNPANTTPADINGQTPGSTAENASFGTINIVDDYVLAQGLIK
ncbi:hypothetical protein N9L14_04195, partial [Alphaproteobacteria bacterium]|nr:hypothetical protein [Alphaproteobacteria bacterium]